MSSTEVAIREVFDLKPSNLTEAMEYAKLIAASDLVPKDYKNQPGNVLVAVQMGGEVGLKPMQSLQTIAVINGRPSIWGDAGLALVEASGLLEDFHEMDFEEIAKAGKATCTAVRAGRPSTIERTFSREDAKKAGLSGKAGPWTQYECRMLQMRARWFVLRDGFADVLKGLHAREEVQDYDAIEETGPRVIGMPRRASEAQPVADANGEEIQHPAQNGEARPATIPEAPSCPDGHGVMALKPAGKKTNGEHYQPFYSCAQYPACKKTVREQDWIDKRAQMMADAMELREPGQDG